MAEFPLWRRRVLSAQTGTVLAAFRFCKPPRCLDVTIFPFFWQAGDLNIRKRIFIVVSSSRLAFGGGGLRRWV